MSLTSFSLSPFFLELSSLTDFTYMASGSSSFKKKKIFGLLKLNPKLTLDDTIFFLNNSIHIMEDFELTCKAQYKSQDVLIFSALRGHPSVNSYM